MLYLALATDYDGTIAHHGVVDAETVAALKRARDAGRKLVLVTGRELDDLRRSFPRLDLFDRVVAENGALLFDPAHDEQMLLTSEPPAELVTELRRRKVEPLSVGRGIVATWSPHETTVLEVIRDLGLEHQVIFNKGAVMVLPPGVNKASGMRTALAQLGLSPYNVVGVGDAENDHAFLSICGLSVAVANAIDTLKREADWVAPRERGEGVQDLIARMLSREDNALPASPRHAILIGYQLAENDETKEADEEVEEKRVFLPSYGDNLLIAGTSGSGKTSALSAVLEGIADRGFQFCLIDPEGDFDGWRDALVLGGATRTSELEEVQAALGQTEHSVVVNLLGLPLAERPQYFKHLLLRIQENRDKSGRPHWLVVDEAHHCLPEAESEPLSQEMNNFILVTVRPSHVNQKVCSQISRVLATGREAESTLNEFFEFTAREKRHFDQRLQPGMALHWSSERPLDAAPLRLVAPTKERRRHRRKYAEGKLGPDKSFYFRGPRGALNLRAHNLLVFVELARGVDEATWAHHLSLHHYSDWFAHSIKDDEVAQRIEEIERLQPVPADSRERVIGVILEHYTLPE